MMRYEVHAVADANCDSIVEEIGSEFDSLTDAKWYADNWHGPFGSAILDTETGLIDFGQGFGVEIEAPDND